MDKDYQAINANIFYLDESAVEVYLHEQYKRGVTVVTTAQLFNGLCVVMPRSLYASRPYKKLQRILSKNREWDMIRGKGIVHRTHPCYLKNSQRKPRPKCYEWQILNLYDSKKAYTYYGAFESREKARDLAKRKINNGDWNSKYICIVKKGCYDLFEVRTEKVLRSV